METPSAQAKMMANKGYDRLLETLAAVPDDKLKFSPSATCKSPLEIAAHCGYANAGLAGAIRGEQPAFRGTLEEMDAAMKPMLASIETRQQVLDLLADSISKVNSALDTVTPESMNTLVSVPFGDIPLMYIIFAPGQHMSGHASQIDYIQTIYGDQQNHMTF